MSLSAGAVYIKNVLKRQETAMRLFYVYARNV